MQHVNRQKKEKNLINSKRDKILLEFIIRIMKYIFEWKKIGRLNTEFEDLLAPLIEANLIIVHGQHVYS
jgi:hypothetical protein